MTTAEKELLDLDEPTLKRVIERIKSDYLGPYRPESLSLDTSAYDVVVVSSQRLLISGNQETLLSLHAEKGARRTALSQVVATTLLSIHLAKVPHGTSPPTDPSQKLTNIVELARYGQTRLAPLGLKGMVIEDQLGKPQFVSWANFETRNRVRIRYLSSLRSPRKLP